MAGAASAAAGVALTASAPANASPPGGSLYYGRWTVSEDKPVFTARGRVYKTIDVAPCGADFCGVSVSDGGACGPVLFRFLAKNANVDTLRGHGRWGAERKNVVIYSYNGTASGDTPAFDLYVGDGVNFGERSGNMPKYHAEYKRLGGARCRAA